MKMLEKAYIKNMLEKSYIATYVSVSGNKGEKKNLTSSLWYLEDTGILEEFREMQQEEN